MQQAETTGVVEKAWPASGGDWLRLVACVAFIFLVFDFTALALGSQRGEAGIAVAVIVVTLTVLADRWLSRGTLMQSLRSLGLGAPSKRGILTAVAVSTAMIVLVLAYSRIAEVPVTMVPGWLLFVPGLFAQAGIAEEVLFRGFLFGRLRRGRTFWRAALLSSGPFILVHLELLLRMPLAIAVASIALAAIIAFPLAYLFEVGGHSIWAPAILHLVVQGTLKVVVVDAESSTLPILWMCACALVPLIVFLRPLPESRGSRSG